MQGTLDAWQAACVDQLRLSPDPLPWIIVYDEQHAWHIHPDEQLLPAHEKASEHLRFAGREYAIFEVENQGKLWVPGRKPIPIHPQAAAMVYDNETKPFFIVASLDFEQRTQKVGPSEDFRKFFTSLTLHELTHTRQLPQTMPKIKRLQAKYKYPESLDDNLIETTFTKDAEFHRMVDEEKRHFSAAILAKDDATARVETNAALDVLADRQYRFYVGAYRGWSEMEDVFLGLEGSAMWVQFQSSLQLAPKGQSWLDTLIQLSQRTDAWSQSEGLAMFLLLDRFHPGWQSEFFGTEIPDSVQVLRQAVGSPSQ